MPDYDKNIDDPLDAFIFRKAADLIVDPLHNLGLSPSQVTTVSVLFAAMSSIAFLMNHSWIAACYFLIYYILDCADGQLARKFNQTSFFGEVYDWNKDHLVGTLFFMIFIFKVPTAAIAIALMFYPMLLNIATLDAVTNLSKNRPADFARSPERNDGIWYGYFLKSKIACANTFRMFFGKCNDNFIYQSAKLIRFFGTGTFTVLMVISMLGYPGIFLTSSLMILAACMAVFVLSRLHKRKLKDES